MSETPPVSSWVDLGTSPVISRRTTPVPFGSNSDYIRMLREAQSETSCRTSARVSPITSAFMSQSSTCRNSPTPGSCSPRSPPPSPCPEVEYLQEDLLASGIFINRMREPEATTAVSEFMWDWSSRTQPQERLRGSSSTNKTGSSDTKKSYSKKAFFSLLLTNLISLVIGAGLGVWIYRRNSGARTFDIFLD